MPSPSLPRKNYKYYDFIMAAFVTVMLCSNLISAPKRTTLGQVPGLGEVVLGSGVVFFPITYIFGDILTEVYGYARSRRVVWAGFAASAFAALVSFVTVQLPPDPGWSRHGQTEQAYAEFRALPPAEQEAQHAAWQVGKQKIWETVFGGTWRIVLASLVAFLFGEFANSYVLAKMKIWTNGRWLWTRIVGSTVVGELIDSFLYLHLAFSGVDGWGERDILRTMSFNYVAKVANEILMAPATYWLVAFLKKAENEDFYDRDTDFTPFKLGV